MTGTSALASATRRDPLMILRSYHALAPWSLRDLATLAGTLLEAAIVVPVNRTARTRPTERTLRYYVAQGLLDPPDGRGTAAVYRYRHLLQVLGIKLRQMEGATLETVKAEFAELSGDTLERRVASALGAGVPSPEELGGSSSATLHRGRTARAGGDRPGGGEPHGGEAPRSTLVRRVSIAPGVALEVDALHPLFRHAAADDRVAEAVAQALRAVADPVDDP